MSLQPVNSTAYFGGLPKNSDTNPSVLCVADGALSYRPTVEYLTSGVNIDNISATGTYRAMASNTGLPEGVTPQGAIVRHTVWDANRHYQEVLSMEGIFFRYKTTQGWKPWQSLFS